MPLLVGLAGADWVSEEVSRMRWGRAFTVAWGEHRDLSRAQHGQGGLSGFKQSPNTKVSLLALAGTLTQS